MLYCVGRGITRRKNGTFPKQSCFLSVGPIDSWLQSIVYFVLLYTSEFLVISSQRRLKQRPKWTTNYECLFNTMDHTVSKMSHSLLFTLICAAVQLSFSSLNTTFLVDRDNSTFEIVLQPPRECPEKYYLHKARQGEFVLNDGRDVAEETGKCIKCSQCLDGIEVRI